MSSDQAIATDPHAATLAKLQSELGEGVFSMSRFRDNLRLFVPPERLAGLAREPCKSECGFNLLSELGATDYLGYPGRTRRRFEVHYVLRNLDNLGVLDRQGGSRRPGPGTAFGGAATGAVPTGWNAKFLICSASDSSGIPTCGGS